MKMPSRLANRRRQRGATLIEGLVSIAIFSFGILAIVGMLATHMSTAADARYRVEAAQYAESIVADIRLTARADRATKFGEDGSKFTEWADRLSAAGGLPMSGSNSERLSIDLGATSTTVTIRWRAPSDRIDGTHQYTTSTFIE